jgi:hypothetical protein
MRRKGNKIGISSQINTSKEGKQEKYAKKTFFSKIGH